VLEEDDVDFTLPELTFLLEQGGESSHGGAAWLDLLIGEEAELAELGGEDLVLVGGERFESLELGEDRADSSACDHKAIGSTHSSFASALTSLAVSSTHLRGSASRVR
jgi:hypothetical protein